VSREGRNRRRGRRTAPRAGVKFLVDHNVRAEVGNLLEGSGFHTARRDQRAKERSMRGSSDAGRHRRRSVRKNQVAIARGRFSELKTYLANAGGICAPEPSWGR